MTYWNKTMVNDNQQFDVCSINIKNRYSCRSYLSKPVAEEILNGIMDAGLLAPSSKNRQPWEIHVIRGSDIAQLVSAMVSKISGDYESIDDEELRNDLRMALITMDIIKKVPILLVVSYKDRKPYHNARIMESGITDRVLVDLLSIGAFIENTILEATERGLGSLWVGDFLYANEVVKDFLNIDSDIVSMVALGYPAEERYNRPIRCKDRVFH